MKKAEKLKNMDKLEKIKKIKERLKKYGGSRKVTVETGVGTTYLVKDLGEGKIVEVDVLEDDGSSLLSPNTFGVDAEYLTEKELDKIINQL